MYLSGFFDYKPGNNGALFSLPHIIFIIIATFLFFFLPICLRHVSRKKITLYLRIMAVVMFFWEGIKIIWETHYDLQVTGSFNLSGLLPLYLCSMFIYVLPFAGYGKGKVQRCALGFLCSLGIVGGFSNIFFPNIFNNYPFFSYASFVSLGFHSLMVFTGIWLLISGYFVPKKSDFLWAFLPTILFAIIVIPIAYGLQSKGINNDYMLILHAYGVPVLESLGQTMIAHHLQWLFSILMILVFWLITILMLSLAMGIRKICLSSQKRKKEKGI